MIPFSVLSMMAVVLDRDGQGQEVEFPLPEAAPAFPRGVRRALVVGAGAVGQSLAKNLEADGRYKVVGFADDGGHPSPNGTGPVLGRRDEVPELVRHYSIDEVFVAYAPTWQQRLVDQLAADHPGVAVNIVPSVYEVSMCLGKVESRDDLALVRLAPRVEKDRDYVKRVFDLVVALTTLLFLSPLLLGVALLIRIVSPGPAIFAQERVGRYGKLFRVYKFRTMVHNAEAETGPVLANGAVDPRLTTIGRWLRLFRIDELPQLWNVVRGEMSLVGPRPERPHFVRKYERMIPSYHKRHLVRPGITGLAQVCAGYHTDPRDKLRFDLIYASHKSLYLDLQIMLRTILVVLVPRNHEPRRRP